MKRSPHRLTTRSGGFTLVELLVVLTIIVTMMVVSFPALSGMVNSGSVNAASSALSLTIDQARTYAMAHNTYVWIGFNNVTPANLTVGVVAGITGEATDITSASTYVPVSKIQTYHNFELKKNITGLSGMTQAGDDISDSGVGTFSQTGANGTVPFTYIMQFSPRGEASIATTAPNSLHCLQIGLQPVHGSNSNDPNVAVIQVTLLTGQVQVFRK